MVKLPTHGYRPKSLAADISLGIFDGLDNALWCYAFASVIFVGAMAPFLPLLSAILLCGWALWKGQRDERPHATFSLASSGLFILAFAAISLGMLALFLDLEHKLYTWRLYLTFEPASPMSWGASSRTRSRVARISEFPWPKHRPEERRCSHSGAAAPAMVATFAQAAKAEPDELPKKLGWIAVAALGKPILTIRGERRRIPR